MGLETAIAAAMERVTGLEDILLEMEMILETILEKELDLEIIICGGWMDTIQKLSNEAIQFFPCTHPPNYKSQPRLRAQFFQKAPNIFPEIPSYDYVA